MPVVEISLEALKQDYDWAHVFGEESGSSISNATDECPPGSLVDTSTPLREHVEEIIAAVNGENDGAEWVGLFRLKDGRFLVAAGGCDYTGWG